MYPTLREKYPKSLCIKSDKEKYGPKKLRIPTLFTQCNLRIMTNALHTKTFYKKTYDKFLSTVTKFSNCY